MSDKSWRPSPKSQKQKSKLLKKKRREKKENNPQSGQAQRKPEQPPSKQFIIGKADMFQESKSKHGAPMIVDHKFVVAYHRTTSHVTDYMQRIGNIELLWHGTSMDNLEGIAKQGLQIKGRHGLFGAGIYFSPRLEKAILHARGGRGGKAKYRAILKCAVAMGKAFRTDQGGCHKDFLQERGYHSLKAFDGKLAGAYGGNLRYPEYIVYRHSQVVVKTIFVYKSIWESRYWWGRTRGKVVPSSVTNHPCKRDGSVCKSAFGDGGCVTTNRKKGCTAEDAKFCPHYDS